MGTSFVVNAEEIAEEIKRAVSESIIEEDLRQGVEYNLKSKIIEKLKEIEKVEILYASWRMLGCC